ncbi:hypothetical protein [Saccharopolyspora mangrovi]|uniref:Uncharacterized protein n=1 Tax=Saccharopolyspora mangrovi TaxID=3082379 RepID=A0ABU6AF35_9PSEU|nr:hypothetical protein [Saccharopolyspora sp. S2-29]MEB3370067.1 hypothetical protein [Saccharopolyspora sp. S2-29]
MTTAAQQPADRPTVDPMDGHRYTADTVTAALAKQRSNGHGWHPALPWMARPEHRTLSPELGDYLQRLEAAIQTRHAETRTSHRRPTRLGLCPRPVQALREEVLETREDHRDDYVERKNDYRDEDAAHRESKDYYERYDYDDDELDQGSGFHSGTGL